MKWTPALLLFLCTVAVADEGKRPIPDYDGRGDPPTTAGDVLIWVPRLAMAPLYLVSEYVVRRPMELAVETAERHQWVQRVMDYLNGPVGIVPTGLMDTSGHFTGGFYFFWNDALASGNEVRATASVGPNSLSATLLDRFTLDDGRWQLAARGAVSRRDDAQFWGIGPGTRFDNSARYEDHRLEGNIAAELRLFGLSRVRLEFGVRSVQLNESSCCSDPSIREAVAMGQFPLPPGYAEGGYTGPFSRAQLVLDSRPYAPGTGVALALEGDEGSDPSTSRVWLRASATLSGALELAKRNRVASLILHAEMASPVQGNEVPFTELASLGGSGPLPGFGPGRLIGRSALAATLQYEWPVWAYLTGVVQAGTGEVFGPHFDGVELGRLRGSAAMGLRSVGNGDHRFELLVALGTRPFDDGMSVDEVRVVVGGVIGF